MKFGNTIGTRYDSCLLCVSSTSTVYQMIWTSQLWYEWYVSKCWKDETTTVKGMSKGDNMFLLFYRNDDILCDIHIELYIYHENIGEKSESLTLEVLLWWLWNLSHSIRRVRSILLNSRCWTLYITLVSRLRKWDFYIRKSAV